MALCPTSFNPRSRQRILVVGATGSGKSTLASILSVQLGIFYMELDDLYWAPGWTPSPDFETRVQQVLQDHESWIADGNYRKVQPLLLDRADCVVWLDYPIWVNFWRLLRRCLHRWWHNTPLWSSLNHEIIWTHFTDWNNSLFVWLWKTHGPIRQRYLEMKMNDESSVDGGCTRQWIHLQSPRSAERWLDTIDCP